MKQRRLLSKPIGYLLFCLTGFLFLFCILTERELAATGNIVWTASHAAQILGGSLAVGAALGALICTLFYRWARNCFELNSQKRSTEGACRRKNTPFTELSHWLRQSAEEKNAWKVFGGSFILIFLAWLPAFLAYYPAICAYDIPVQTEQIVSGMYIDHHPIAHTLLLKWAMIFGKNVLGNVNTGIGCYALFQMILLAAAFAFGMYCLCRHNARRVWLIVVELFCMLYPFHLYISVSVTKDTVFSAFFLICLLALSETLQGRKAYAVPFVLSGTGVILFRNNGKYAFLVLLLFLFAAFVFGRDRRRFLGGLFILGMVTFLVGNIALAGIFRAVNAEQGDKREMLSIPIQQLARTMVYHGGIGVLPEDDGAMSDVDRALINDFILDEAYRDYRPDFTDPVKRHTNTYVARYRAKEFLSTYLGLFLQFPGDYLNAALAVDAGYLYPGDVSHAYINAQEGDASGGGYVQTRWDEDRLGELGIYKDSRWPGLWEYMEKWADDNAYLQIPVLKYLFVPGVWIWLYLLLAGWLLLTGQLERCLPLTLVFGYFLTLLLGPTVQLRYLYPMMAAFPFLLLLSVLPEKSDTGTVL